MSNAAEEKSGAAARPAALILADLHLDHWIDEGRDPFALLPAGWFDRFGLVIVAGDLSNKPMVHWPRALDRIGQYIDLTRVHVVPGNHDYYFHMLDGDADLEEISRAAGAGFAQCQAFHFGATRFLCCTLWTDSSGSGEDRRSAAMAEAETRMSDYRYIRIHTDGYRGAAPSDTAAVHARHRAWLAAELTRPHDGRTVVVTHHSPHMALSGPPTRLAPAYGSDLTHLIESTRPAAWAFGHTHAPGSVEIGPTRLLNVSLGFPDEISDEEGCRRILSGALTLEEV